MAWRTSTSRSPRFAAYARALGDSLHGNSMTRSIIGSVLLLAGCMAAGPVPVTKGHPAHYLYVWAGDMDGVDPDFLAVFDVLPSSPTYGAILSSTPVGTTPGMPHHLEYAMPPEGALLFANDHWTEAVSLLDTRDAVHPAVARVLPPIPPLRYPHDFVRLPNGHLLVGYLRSDGPSPLPGDSTSPGGHGGIAEVTAGGDLVRWRSAADSTIDVPIRPYAFAVLPAIDRAVVTSAAMLEDTSANVVQIWRLSDLTLLRTMPVPEAALPDGTVLVGSNGLPFEPRVLDDGSVFFNTYRCGFYHLTGIADPAPVLRPVYAIPTADRKGACGVPLHVGPYWIMAVGRANSLVTLDIRDPQHPREVQRLYADSLFRPHWLAYDPGGSRIVVGAENGGETRMLLATVDTATGQVSWDARLRTPGGMRGLSFERTTWPHGATGPAFGHAALFRR